MLLEIFDDILTGFEDNVCTVLVTIDVSVAFDRLKPRVHEIGSCHFLQQSAYQCNVCGQSFNQKSNLQAHFLIHAAVKPIECKKCRLVLFFCHNNIISVIVH